MFETVGRRRVDLGEVETGNRRTPFPKATLLGKRRCTMYYTGLGVPLVYVKALLSAEEFRTRGLKAIPHGRSPKLYASILRYAFSFQPEDAPMIADEVVGKEQPALLPEGDDGWVEALHDAIMADAGGVEDGVGL